MGLFGAARGQSRSLEIASINELHTSSYQPSTAPFVRHSNVLVENYEFYLCHTHLALLLGMTQTSIRSFTPLFTSSQLTVRMA